MCAYKKNYYLFFTFMFLMGCEVEAVHGVNGDCGNGHDLGDEACQCIIPDGYVDSVGSAGSHGYGIGPRLDVHFCGDETKSYSKPLSIDEVYVCIDYRCDKQVCPDGQVRDLSDMNSLRCVPRKKCSGHEIYDAATDTCLCDRDNHWEGVSGLCHCQQGYVERYGKCREMACPVNHIYDNDLLSCVCNGSKHWEGIAGDCKCAKGYNEVNGVCEPMTCSEREIYDSLSSACICDAQNHWEGVAGDCKCAKGYNEVDGVCEAMTCPDREIYDSSSSACICDAQNHWEGVSGDCKCAKGYNEVNGVCEAMTCPEREIYDSLSSACICDAQNHWEGVAGDCKCAKGYNEVNGVCEAIVCTDREVYDDSINSCVCDNSRHWEGRSGECWCMVGYVLKDGNCELVPQCDPDTEIYEVETNTCSCAEGFIRIKGKCEKKAECDPKREMWEADTNQCFCNTGYVSFNQRCVTVGDYVTFGRYKQSESGETLDDLEWLVLSVDNSDDRLLLLSRYVLEFRSYHLRNEDVVWKDSTLRSWLNGYDLSVNHIKDYTKDNFKDTAFNADEQKKIIRVTLENNESPKGAIIPLGINTEDDIFVLDFYEIHDYFDCNYTEPCQTDIGYVTNYSVTSGCVEYPNMHGCPTSLQPFDYSTSGVSWWLRTPGARHDLVMVITGQGRISNVGAGVSQENIKLMLINPTGVRPSLWVKGEKI